MPDTRDDFAIRHVAALARLHLTPDEESLYARQLADILAYARRVLDVDTSAAGGAPGPVPAVVSPLRDDEPRRSLEQDQALNQAPPDGQGHGLFRVPRVIG